MIANTLSLSSPWGDTSNSLWKCEVCETFVSIHSRQVVTEVNCPLCAGRQLTFCGSLEQILGAGTAQA
jgi:hypothetical protein